MSILLKVHNNRIQWKGGKILYLITTLPLYLFSKFIYLFEQVNIINIFSHGISMIYEPEKIYPRLIEPGVKFFLDRSLHHAHIFKVEYYNSILNIILFALCLLTIVCVLTYKYKGKLSKDEIEIKSHETHQYVLEKIKKFQVAKRQMEQELITGLPHWDKEY
jgi:hypothetical protein